MSTIGRMVNLLRHRQYEPLLYRTQWIDEDSATFPLFDFNGSLSGYQRYTPRFPKDGPNPQECRYFTFSPNKQLVWGLDFPLKNGPIFLTESIFKASAIHLAGYNAWSVNGSSLSKSLKQQLALLPHRFIPIGDDDVSGKKFANQYPGGFVYDDIDEVPQESLKVLLKNKLHSYNSRNI